MLNLKEIYAVRDYKEAMKKCPRNGRPPCVKCSRERVIACMYDQRTEETCPKFVNFIERPRGKNEIKKWRAKK